MIGNIKTGDLTVETAKFGAHPPEWFAQKMTDKIIMVADSAPQPIRDQAMAFRESVYAISLHFVREAMKSAKAEHRMFTAGD